VKSVQAHAGVRAAETEESVALRKNRKREGWDSQREQKRRTFILCLLKGEVKGYVVPAPTERDATPNPAGRKERGVRVNSQYHHSISHQSAQGEREFSESSGHHVRTFHGWRAHDQVANDKRRRTNREAGQLAGRPCQTGLMTSISLPPR